MSDYVVIYEQGEDGAWGAYLPDLPGVVALGATRAEVGERIEEALAAYAEDLRRGGGLCPSRIMWRVSSRPDRQLLQASALGGEAERR